MISSLPVAAVLVFFGGSILEFVVGGSYRPAEVGLAILCIAELANVATGPVRLILDMTGHERDTWEINDGDRIVILPPLSGG